MSLIRLNQLHAEILSKVDEKDVLIKKSIETSLQYTIGSVAPATPSIGYRWFDTTTSLMKIWNGSGSGADWEITNSNVIYLPGKNALDALSTSRKQITTGTGFLDFGGSIASEKVINQSLLANSGIPRLAGIEGEDDTAIKYFWFQNFMLLNANGYSEETLGVSSGETTEVLVNGNTITMQGTLPNSPSIVGKKLMALNLPEAPKKVSELTRNELVFIEVWREEVDATGFIFPYGNVQYTGDDADGITTTAFTGNVGYCSSFSGDGNVVTNADGTTTTVPKGRGWIWNDLKTSFKSAIAANFRHNVFVEGDKLVQIRYRVRISSYSSFPAGIITDTTVLGYSADNDANSVIKAQGRLGELNTTDVNYNILAPFNIDNPHALNGTYSTEYTSDLSQNGFVYAIPVALVSRRNNGVFDTIFNPNGSARFRDGIRLVADYDESDDIIGFALMDKANSTLASSTTGLTWNDKYNIMMQWLFDRKTILTAYDNAAGFVIGGDMNSGISGRYDGLYHDEINEVDVLDLRMDVNKQLDLNYILEKEFNKFISGDQRGWDQEKRILRWVGTYGVNAPVRKTDGTFIKDVNGNQVHGYGYVSELPIYYKLKSGVEIQGIPTTIVDQISENLSTTIAIRPGKAPVTTEEKLVRSGYSNKFTHRRHISLAPVLDSAGKTQLDVNDKLVQKIIISDGAVYVDESTELIVVTPKKGAHKKTQLYADIIGDPAGNSYKFSTTTVVSDLPATAILENGNIVFTGQNYYVYRGARKTKTQLEQLHKDQYGYFKIDETNTNEWILSTGKGGYSEGWKMYGTLGNAYLVDEEGTSIIPRDVTSGMLDSALGLIRKNTKFFKLSKPVKSIKKVLVTVDKKSGKKSFLTQITATKTVNGVTQTILDQVDSTPGTFGFDNSTYLVNGNIIAINWGSYTDDAIIEIYYSVDSSPAWLTESTRVEALGDVWVGNSMRHDMGGKVVSNLIDKVSTHDATVGSKGAAMRIPLSTYLISRGVGGAILNSEWSIITHQKQPLAGEGPAVKILPYITSVRGEMYLKVLYKELDKSYTGTQHDKYWYDNGEFVVANGETTDNNGGIPSNVKIGQRKIKLPYYFGKIA